MKHSLHSLVAALVLLTALPAIAGLKEGVASYKSKDYRTAFAELDPLAQKGDGQALYYVGMLYSDGLGVDQNLAEAMRLFRRSAEQGNPDGQNAMGYSYMMGDGVEKNFDTARLWLNKAAAQGSTKAYRSLGKTYLDGWGVKKDEAQATAWYRKSADAGDPVGCWLLGRSYEMGLGIPKDIVKAVAWYRKSSDQGDPDGQYELWRMYDQGLGVQKDEALGLQWLRKSAVQGHKTAQYYMAQAFETGKGVTKDFKVALAWYLMSAEQGDVDAQSKVGNYYKVGRGTLKNYAEAAVWLRKAAEQGEKFAQHELAQLYMHGEGVPKDMAQAVAWSTKASEQGVVDAQTNLAVFYRTGDGVQKDRERATYWATKAAEGGNVNALYLANPELMATLTSEGSPENPERASRRAEIISALTRGSFSPEDFGPNCNVNGLPKERPPMTVLHRARHLETVRSVAVRFSQCVDSYTRKIPSRETLVPTYLLMYPKEREIIDRRYDDAFKSFSAYLRDQQEELDSEYQSALRMLELAQAGADADRRASEDNRRWLGAIADTLAVIQQSYKPPPKIDPNEFSARVAESAQPGMGANKLGSAPNPTSTDPVEADRKAEKVRIAAGVKKPPKSAETAPNAAILTRVTPGGQSAEQMAQEKQVNQKKAEDASEAKRLLSEKLIKDKADALDRESKKRLACMAPGHRYDCGCMVYFPKDPKQTACSK